MCGASDADTGALPARGRNDLRDIVRRSRRRLGRRAPDVRAAPAAPLTRGRARPPRRLWKASGPPFTRPPRRTAAGWRSYSRGRRPRRARRVSHEPLRRRRKRARVAVLPGPHNNWRQCRDP